MHLVQRLCSRRPEIEEGIFARVRAVSDLAGSEDAEYLPGLRATITAVVVAVAQAQRAGEDSPTDITQMEGTFTQTQAILDPQGKLRETPETKEWLKSDTYMTVMHGHFTSSDVPKGQTPPQGTVMVVITDSHTGWVEGEYIGPTAPSSAALSPVSVSNPSNGEGK